METRAHHILIGLFTLLATAAMLLFALWLGKAGGERQFSEYDVVFREPVSGLSRGGKVEFNGVRVGEVTGLRLDPDDPHSVYARVKVDSSAPVRSDTRARLVLAGVTGTSFIRLSSGNGADSPPLRAPGGQVPVIVATPSPISKLMSGGEDLLVNVNELLMQARALLSTENAESLRQTLRHLEQASGAIASQREEMATALRQVAQASERANAALAEATRTLGAASRLIDGPGTQTLQGAQRSLAAFEQALRTLDQLVADNRGQLDSGVRGLAELGPTLAELRATLASLRSISRRLEDRPADFLLGLEPVQEFQP